MLGRSLQSLYMYDENSGKNLACLSAVYDVKHVLDVRCLGRLRSFRPFVSNTPRKLISRVCT
jgi:hypothetical protein